MSQPNVLNYFLPYQVNWIRCPARIAIGQKSRRIGWTYASSYRAVERRLRLGTNLYFSSADLSAAREFIEYCGRWSRVFDAVAQDQGERVIDEAGGIRAFVLRFKTNGAKIVAGSSNPKFFRSKGGDADADEFAFHADPRELYKAMQPAALVWGHQVRVWSTHNGEGSFFNQLIKAAGEGSGVQVQTVTLPDAVEQGLVEKIQNLNAPNPAARQAFLEEIRAGCPDEDSWNEEYLCRPSSEQSSLLSYAVIRDCEAEFAPAELEELPGTGSDPTGGARTFYAGFDVGRKHDRSVLWVLEKVGDVFWTRVLRVLNDASFTEQEQLLHALLANRRIKRLCIDSTGIGAMLAERVAQRFGHRAEAIHFSAPVKAELAMPLLRLFQDRLVRVPAESAVREDLHKVRKIITASNHVRLDATRDAAGHADRFWALALAYHASDDALGRVGTALSSVRKPIGW